MTINKVFLRDKGDVVGYARYVFLDEDGLPIAQIHGHRLQQFAKRGEDLVAIRSVQIFSEFEKREYPYKFRSFEELPVLLGDLNDKSKAFKTIIAWDRNKLVESPQDDVRELGLEPRVVSAKTISPIRHTFHSSPMKVRFFDDVDKYLDERLEESLDQFEDEPIAEQADMREASRKLSEAFMEGFDESVAQFEFGEQLRIQETSRDLLPEEGRFDFSDNEEDHERTCRGSVKRKVTNLSRTEQNRRKCFERKSKRHLRSDTGHNISLFHGHCDHNGSSTLAREGNVTGPTFGVRTSEGRQDVSGIHSSETKGNVEEDSTLAIDENGISPSSAYHVQINRTAPLSGVMSNRGTIATPAATELVSPTYFDGLDVVCSSPAPGCFAQNKFKKRSYRFHERNHAVPKQPSDLEKKRMAQWRATFNVNPFELMAECCGNECHSAVNPEYAVVQYRRFLKMNRVERKRALRYMYNFEESHWWFDGVQVCSRFVCALSFSNQLQSAVKGTPKARASASVLACPREIRSENMKDKIIMFLRKLAGAIGDSLPTRNHTNLPLLAKFQVYNRFVKTLGPGQSHPCLSYFCSVWKRFCKNIKTHRRHGFTVCAICEKLRTSLAKYENEEMQAVIRRQMEEHYRVMEEERRGYAIRIELTMKYPSRYLSLIVDGADQKSYGLPHFLFDTKDDQGHKLKVKCIGVLEHGLHKQLSLFTMTEEFDSGANHVLEAIHRVLDRRKFENGSLPEVLFVQADNCTRENKNHFFLAYFQLLVASGVFCEVQISFLPIGHTHADIDQAFSTVASRLRLFDAFTMEDLLRELNNCYTPRAFAEEMDLVANFSGLCQLSRCLFKVQGFSQYRYFRFSRKGKSSHSEDDSGSIGMNGAIFNTTCDVKIQSQDEWCPMDYSEERKGFLKFVPDLQDTPPTDTTPPDNVLEVNKHLQSVEGRVETEENMNRLKALRDKVYTRRSDNFHWDIERAFELHGDYQDDARGDEDSTGVHGSHEVRNTVEAVGYTINSFLAVKTDSQDAEPFWIARTLREERKDERNCVTHLKVRWYQLRKESRDAFSGRYEMSTHITGGTQVFYDDTVDVRSVLCQFHALTQRGGLHVRTQKAIRQCLHMN